LIFLALSPIFRLLARLWDFDLLPTLCALEVVHLAVLAWLLENSLSGFISRFELRLLHPCPLHLVFKSLLGNPARGFC
jgi:hypothetical protein